MIAQRGNLNSMDDELEYIPDSWVDEEGVRHAVIWEPGLPEYMRLEKVNGEWELIEMAPF